MSVDTLSLGKELRAAELTAPQAEAIAAAIGHAVGEATDMRSQSDRLAVEIKASFANLDHRLDALEQRLAARIEASRSSLLIWFVGILITIAGLGVAMAKL